METLLKQSLGVGSSLIDVKHASLNAFAGFIPPNGAWILGL